VSREAFYTPREFEFAVEDLEIPGARVAKRVKGNGDGEFQFEIAHRLCGKKKGGGGVKRKSWSAMTIPPFTAITTMRTKRL